MGSVFTLLYLKPTINFNMLQYITSSDFDLIASLLVNINDVIILERSKHTIHAIFLRRESKMLEKFASTIIPSINWNVVEMACVIITV